MTDQWRVTDTSNAAPGNQPHRSPATNDTVGACGWCLGDLVLSSAGRFAQYVYACCGQAVLSSKA
ncbi:MAG TPA: hypothetical protein VFB90_01440 [Dehalococcoidia bacterium]|nr:hypothetical protein [Dehalococcoidia bacterium]